MWGVLLVAVMAWAATVKAATVTVCSNGMDWQNALRGQYLTEKFADGILNTSACSDPL